MKAVIYARYSSDNQREESIEGQLRECKEFAEKNDFTILNTYIDRALSAKSDNRPEFQKMVKDSGKGLFDIVIVWKLDRFARNRYDSAHYKATLRKNGVKVVSATETIAEDSTGILLESLLEGYAEFYSAELAEKVIRGMKENALKGKYNGGGLSYGYKINEERRFTPDPLTAPVVLDIFKSYDGGMTMKQIVDKLNGQGVATTKGGKITINFVTYLLKNRRYIGEYSYREISSPDMIPPIVPMELFERVQERLAKNKKAPAREKAKEEKYLLTTKLFCGGCGAFMVGESGTSKTKNQIHRYYKCVTAKKKQGCKRKAVRKDWIERLAIEYILEKVFDDELMEQIADKLLKIQKEENANLPLMKKQLADAQKSIDNILDAIQQGIFNSSTKGRLDELEEAKERLTISIAQEEIVTNFFTKEKVLFWLHRFRDTDVTDYVQKQRLIDSFINAIYIYDDRIVLMLNYKDGSKTVSLGDIEGSDLSSLTAPKCKIVARKENVFFARPYLITPQTSPLRL